MVQKANFPRVKNIFLNRWPKIEAEKTLQLIWYASDMITLDFLEGHPT